MIKKLTDKELSLIMSYADGQLDSSNISEVEKIINENEEAKRVFDDLKLSSKVYKDYVSNIKVNPEKILSKSEDNLEKNNSNIFNIIFKNPMRNFVAYPIAALFMFTIGFQMNSSSFRGLDNDTEKFRGMENNAIVDERIEKLENEISNLNKKIEKYLKEIENLKKKLEEKK